MTRSQQKFFRPTVDDPIVQRAVDELHGSLSELGGEFESSYAVSWTATTSAPAIGNGILNGSWYRIGNLITAAIRLTAGSTTTFGSGFWRFGLPFKVSSKRRFTGAAWIKETGVQFHMGVVRTIVATKTCSIYVHGDATELNGTSPFSWSDGDELEFSLTYVRE